MRSMEEALEKAQDEAKKAKDELKKFKQTLDTYKKEAIEAFDKAKEHTRKVEDGFRGLVNKISGDQSFRIYTSSASFFLLVNLELVSWQRLDVYLLALWMLWRRLLRSEERRVGKEC